MDDILMDPHELHLLDLRVRRIRAWSYFHQLQVTSSEKDVPHEVTETPTDGRVCV